MAIAQQATEKGIASILQGANPAPLGLMGFGTTTVLLNLHNAGIITGSSLGMIFAMGIFYGGIAQIIAGLLEFIINVLCVVLCVLSLPPRPQNAIFLIFTTQ
jgi:succinate-acetate transporter protein